MVAAAAQGQGDAAAREMVVHPAHYNTARVECIEVIEDLGLNFNCGSALKYLWRTGLKDPERVREDLEKARFYLDREVAALGGKPWNPSGRVPNPRKVGA